ncbi:hypothetical protein UFOVP1433_26 [uncultured Caudovirales phage]|uniref:Uncharacterized protein n=1 Tax=uncultured Caudovirales phage TaxID=2100421 RepID=A0A6J5QF14_9CAUD|nr:hypothetical protein UFOVP553_26 [uncultured Caudovirales phage]CAB4182883.1 hypothetical protein UFOVP1081_26 [uncultured Caudovirales phage]CAB4212814.1 hypothetical protein UFOVP1433_26 [uncultured Caudovirales phage]
MNTLLLELDQWDLVLDASNNIAMATDPYAVAQDVASSCRVFLGDQYYDTSVGVPYFQSILGKRPPLSLVKTQLEAAAARVPGCGSPTVFLSALNARTLSGQVLFTDTNGNVQASTFSASTLPPVAGYSGLIDAGGWVQVVDQSGWPVVPSGLLAGALWSNGGIACVVPGSIPDLTRPIFFDSMTSSLLLATGGANAPISDVGLPPGQIWANGGILSVAGG